MLRACQLLGRAGFKVREGRQWTRLQRGEGWHVGRTLAVLLRSSHFILETTTAGFNAALNFGGVLEATMWEEAG